MEVKELRIEAKPAVENWVVNVMNVKGSAVLIRPSTMRCFQFEIKGCHPLENSIMGSRIAAPIEDLTALSGIAPNSPTEIRAKRKEEPQIAPRTIRIKK